MRLKDSCERHLILQEPRASNVCEVSTGLWRVYDIHQTSDEN